MRKSLLMILSCAFFACQDSQNKKTTAGEALGTTYNIAYYSNDEIPLEEALDSIFRVVNRSMSTYQPDSDISRINAGDTLVVVDTLFQRVFLLSQQVHRESRGYFDPTVGDLVNMYGFGPEKTLNVIDSATVDSLMPFVGLSKVRISPEGRVEKDFPEIYLDFNAIAKGYAIDLVGHYLESKGVENYLVELGGELLGRGQNLDRQAPWIVGIDDPDQQEGQRKLKAGIELKDRAMATSGNYRKFRIDPATGTTYVHTINPLTGYPERSSLLSASVLAENCALADAYATAFMALGYDRSLEVLQELENVDVYILYDNQGKVQEYASEGFKELLVEL